jgi:hypothetical protein
MESGCQHAAEAVEAVRGQDEVVVVEVLTLVVGVELDVLEVDDEVLLLVEVDVQVGAVVEVLVDELVELLDVDDVVVVSDVEVLDDVLEVDVEDELLETSMRWKCSWTRCWRAWSMSCWCSSWSTSSWSWCSWTSWWSCSMSTTWSWCPTWSAGRRARDGRRGRATRGRR